MRLAISNIAWDVVEDDDVAKLLNKYRIDAIDIAPGKYFPDPTKVSQADINKIKNWWADRGIEITGMQSLLFGTFGLNLFGSDVVKNILLEKITAICRIGSILGATRLVFGSPKSRDRTGLSDEQAQAEAEIFFRRLGDIAYEQGVVICLEPNPTCYGANFMTTSGETAYVVRAIDHPAIRMQLDTGALTINSESIKIVLTDCAPLIGHIHASEPNLVPLGDINTDHSIMYENMNRFIPDHLVSIEMVATKDEPHLVAIERALIYAIKHYRPQQSI